MLQRLLMKKTSSIKESCELTEKELLDRFSNVVREVIETKQRLDLLLEVIAENEKEHLPAQTFEFMNKAEFATTSLISCLHMANESKRNKFIKSRIKEL